MKCLFLEFLKVLGTKRLQDEICNLVFLCKGIREDESEWEESQGMLFIERSELMYRYNRNNCPPHSYYSYVTITKRIEWGRQLLWPLV